MAWSGNLVLDLLFMDCGKMLNYLDSQNISNNGLCSFTWIEIIGRTFRFRNTFSFSHEICLNDYFAHMKKEIDSFRMYK